MHYNSAVQRRGHSTMPRRGFTALLLLFAISGAGALVVETVWMRWLRDWLGATAPAAAAATTAYFAGSALGAWLGARVARGVRGPKHALRLYAWVEMLAAAGAIATPSLLAIASAALTAVYASLADSRVALITVRFVSALLVVLPAAVAYGATFPLIASACLDAPRAIGSRGTALYSVNAGGAVVGVALATWWAPPLLGVDGTYAVGIGFALAAAAGAWALAGKDAEREEESATDTTPLAQDATTISSISSPPPSTSSLAPEAVVLSALSGFVALCSQVLLVHAIAQIVNQSVIAFGAVLMTLLGCLALGAFAVSALRSSGIGSGRSIAGWALATSAVAFAMLPTWLHRVTGGLAYVDAERFGGAYGPAVVMTVLVSAGPALLAAACIWPATLAYAGETGTHHRDAPPETIGAGEAGARIGLLSAANTVGAIAGGVTAPFIILPALGPWGGFLVPAGLCVLGTFVLILASGESSGSGAAERTQWPPAAAAITGVVAVLITAGPNTLPLTRTAGDERVLFERSGASGVVAVVERDGERLIRVDNHYALGGSAERVHEERQGHLPLLIHGRPERVAFVGTATGITAGAAIAHDVDTIHLVEIMPAVAQAGREFFADFNRGVYADPRTTVVIDDARNFWRHTSERFDVIVADLFVPWRAGAGALYSRENFEAMRERLMPGGLVAQWLPLYQLSADEFAIIVATFTEIFAETALFRGDFYGRFPIVALIGWNDSPAPAAAITSSSLRLRDRVSDRWVTDPVAFWSLYIGEAKADESVARNSLNRPQIEYLASRRHVGGARGKIDPHVGLDWVAAVDQQQSASAEPDALYPHLPRAAHRARRGGSIMQHASALYLSGRTERAGQRLAEAAALLPPSVLAQSPPDPSVADVWFDTAR